MKGLPPMSDVKSSNIAAVGYRGETLFVRFVGGSLYSYDKVPADVYHDLMKSESPGSVFRSKVRGTFKHTKHDG